MYIVNEKQAVIPRDNTLNIVYIRSVITDNMTGMKATASYPKSLLCTNFSKLSIKREKTFIKT